LPAAPVTQTLIGSPDNNLCHVFPWIFVPLHDEQPLQLPIGHPFVNAGHFEVSIAGHFEVLFIAGHLEEEL
jgi:hypothetical protein